MGLFGKRSDGKRVTQGDPLMHIIPYLMRTRTESHIYYKRTIVVDQILDYIKEQRRHGRRITMFNIVIAALLQTVHRRPVMNRFIAGRRLYERNKFEVLYTVKQNLTDEGLESVAKVPLDPKHTIFDISDIMADHIRDIKKGVMKGDDKMIRFFSRMPRWVIRSVAALFRFLDFHGWMPKDLIETLPFYSTVFVSHLGSLGADAPFHHLYEFGTNSVFLVIGRTYDVPFKGPQGEVIWKRCMDLAFSVDERVCDGFYYVRSLRILEQFLLNPRLLEYPASDDIDIFRPKEWPFRQAEDAQGEAAGDAVEPAED